MAHERPCRQAFTMTQQSDPQYSLSASLRLEIFKTCITLSRFSNLTIRKKVTTSPKNIHQPTQSIMSTRHLAIQGYYLALQMASATAQNQLFPTFKEVDHKKQNPQIEEAFIIARQLVSSCSASLPLSACISVLLTLLSPHC